MYFAAPTMRRTGHGGRHRAQPMQRASSIQATRGGRFPRRHGIRAYIGPKNLRVRELVAAPPGGIG